MEEPSSSQTASMLRHLLDETADLIDSPSFTHVLTLLNNEGFAMLVERKCARGAFKSESSPQSFTSLAVGGASEMKTKLANVLAVLARQAHVIGNGANTPNEYLSAMDQGVRELEAFAAVVYSSNLNVDLLGPGQKPGLRQPPVETPSSLEPVVVEKEESTSEDEIKALDPHPEEGGVDGVQTETAEAPAEGGPSETVGEESAFERAWETAVVEEKAAAQHG